MNRLGLGVQVAGVRFLSKRKPLFVTLRVTNRCNFNCVYCDYSSNKDKDPTSGQIRKCIDEFSRAGTYKFGFTGGEPMLRKDIGELISYAKKAGLVTTMTSNGWHVAQRIEDLKDLDVIILSLDGTEKVHDENRRKGSFKRVMDAARICRHHGIKVIGLTVLTRTNLNQIGSILELADQYGFQQIFQPVETRDFFKSGLSEVAPDKEGFLKALSEIRSAKKYRNSVLNSTAYLDFLESWPNYEGKTVCWAGRISCVINTDGTVLPCNNLSRAGKTASGFKTGFKHAFEKMEGYACEGCWTNCYQENNCVMNLDFLSIADAIGKIGQFKRKNVSETSMARGVNGK